jgi:hypothetical protein
MSKEPSQLGFIPEEDQTEEIEITMTDESQQARDPLS